MGRRSLLDPEPTIGHPDFVFFEGEEYPIILGRTVAINGNPALANRMARSITGASVKHAKIKGTNDDFSVVVLPEEKS